jgi:hypothetical protein
MFKKKETQNQAYLRISKELINLLSKAGYNIQTIEVKNEMSWRGWEASDELEINIKLGQKKATIK